MVGSSALFAHGVEAAAGAAEAGDAAGQEGEDGGADDGRQDPPVVGALRRPQVQQVARVAVLQAGTEAIQWEILRHYLAWLKFCHTNFTYGLIYGMEPWRQSYKRGQ